MGVDQLADGLYRFMLKLCSDSDHANDLVQEAFEKMWLRRNDISFEKFKPYLFKVAYNLFLNQNTRSKKFQSYSNENFMIEDSNSNAEIDVKEQIEIALNRLPEIQKTVVMLRDYEGYNYEEIAELTDLNLSQVKVYIFRARQSLKNYLVSLEHII